MWGSMRQSTSDLESQSNVPPASQPSNSSLSWDLRVQGFIGCFILSVVSSFSASYLLILLRPSGFCIMTSISAILSMAGTCCLTGPISQLKSMFHKSRWLSSSLYLFFIVMSIIAGLWLKNTPLAIICVVGEYIALFFYTVSYIPYAREFICRLLCSCV